MKKYAVMVLFALILFSSFADAQLADSPSPTLKINSKHTGLSQYATDIEKPYLKWKFDTGDGVETSPAVGADGTIYTGSFINDFYAFNPDGTVKWKFTREGEHFRSSPTIAKDGTLYVPAVYDLSPQYSEHLGFAVDFGTPKLYAIDPNGTEKWEFVLGGRMGGVLYSPAIGTDGTIYMISGGAKMPNATGGDKFWAIYPNGTAKWSFDTDEAMYSSAAIADDGTIYFGCADGNFYALTPEGEEKWRFNTGPDAVKRDSIFDAVPSIGPDGTIYIGSRDKNLYALTPEGKEKWHFTTNDTIEATASIAKDGTLYVGVIDRSPNDKNLYAVSPEGKELWRFETGNGVFATPVIDANGILYFGSYDQNLYSLYPNGTERWRFPVHGGIVMPPTIDANGTIYFGSWDHYFYAIDGIERETATVCGDGFCEDGEEIGCRKDCNIKIVCGDGICDEGESYCHDDCEIGQENPDVVDGYQDTKEVGIFQSIIDFFRKLLGFG